MEVIKAIKAIANTSLIPKAILPKIKIVINYGIQPPPTSYIYFASISTVRYLGSN